MYGENRKLNHAGRQMEAIKGAKLSRQHNNTNILAFGARVIGIELAKMIIDEWLSAEFEGGRHQTRVDMITAIENK